MGYDSEKGFSSVGVDPSWQKLLEQLSQKGFSRKDLENNEEFIKDFVNQAGGIDNVCRLLILIWILIRIHSVTCTTLTV